MPAPVTVPSDSVSPPTDIDPTEEEGIIETLDDSASIDLDDLQEEVEQEVIEEEFTITPKKDENSILDTAVKVLQPQAPTSAGESVVEQRSKMLTLTARPVQSHHSSHSQLQRNKVEMQQVTHKRHFRQQNALRPLHRERYEHTAEAPGPVKFKQLPTISKESPTGKTSDVNTGAPALNRSSSSEVMERSSPKMQRLPSSVEKLESETEKDSVIKIARLPILRAESTSSAAIGSLRNFTNVRDLDPGFDKGYYSRKKTEDAGLKAVEVLSDDVVDPITE